MNLVYECSRLMDWVADCAFAWDAELVHILRITDLTLDGENKHGRYTITDPSRLDKVLISSPAEFGTKALQK